MGYEARVILDSAAPNGRRLTTMLWTYPRFVHAEFMTHRDRARNAASSRAIPFETMLRNVTEDPVVPLCWQQEAGGMQGAGEVPEALRPLANAIWHAARKDAQDHAIALRNLEATADVLDSEYMWELTDAERAAIHRWLELNPRGGDEDHRIRVHKTIPNRLVEPWMWITVVTTATEWKNLWRLRVHPDAEVHFQEIAGIAKRAYEASEPVERVLHLPFVTGYDEPELEDELMDNVGAGLLHMPMAQVGEDGTPGNMKTQWLMQVSTARCARISYLTHEGTRAVLKDIELFERLVQGSGFGHWSPHEHPALAHPDADHRSGPFRGWQQFRKMFVGRECADE